MNRHTLLHHMRAVANAEHEFYDETLGQLVPEPRGFSLSLSSQFLMQRVVMAALFALLLPWSQSLRVSDGSRPRNIGLAEKVVAPTRNGPVLLDTAGVIITYGDRLELTIWRG
jgi:hypothetical protein